MGGGALNAQRCLSASLDFLEENNLGHWLRRCLSSFTLSLVSQHQHQWSQRGAAALATGRTHVRTPARTHARTHTHTDTHSYIDFNFFFF